MYYNTFKDTKLSGLGFGTMRLPTDETGRIDEQKTAEMVDLAIQSGVNYFDTAFPYHGGESEIVIGKILKNYPRDSFYLATKFPGHQIRASYDPAEVFERQLEKCGVEYFDFYLLHNVYENSVGVYKDPRYGIIDYFLKQKELGRIKHLGFSSHARPGTLADFLDYTDGAMEFCQIQLNYLDWTLQQANEKYDVLCDYGIPVWVMEPVRGGKLANLGKSFNEKLESLHQGESVASWAFKYLQRFPEVKMILSGMSDMAQVKDNLKTFNERLPLDDKETDLLYKIAEKLKNSIPCTGCRYCCMGCPKHLDIPLLLAAYNDIRFSKEGGMTAAMQMEALDKSQLPTACISCGACARTCPQNIDVPKELKEFSAVLEQMPKWSDICKKREEAEKSQLNAEKS